MKKITVLMLAASCLFIFSGCNGGEPEETEEIPTKTVVETDVDGNPVTNEKGETQYTEVPRDTVVATDENGDPKTDESGNTIYEWEVLPEEIPTVYKVGFVYSGFVKDGATNLSFENARGQIEKVLGLDTCYVENVLVSEFPEAVNVLKEAGCNIIVACSPKYANAVDKEAKSAAETYFMNFGGSKTGAYESSFGGELYQTAAVCGIAAAHNTGSNVIGVVADPGEYNVYGVVNAFVLGAAELWGAHTDVRVNWAWSNSHSEIEAAVDDLIKQGCDVIMSYMETDYAVRYCEKKNVKVVANCYNMPEIAPQNYITGYFFNFSTFLVDEIRSVINDNYNPRVYSGDIAAGMARLVTFGTNVKEGTETIGKKLYDYIKAGNAKVFTGEIKNTEGVIMVEKGQSMTFDNIKKINWLVQGVRKTGDFTEINENRKGSTDEIRKWQTTAAAETQQPPEGTAEQSSPESADNSRAGTADSVSLTITSSEDAEKLLKSIYPDSGYQSNGLKKQTALKDLFDIEVGETIDLDVLLSNPAGKEDVTVYCTLVRNLSDNDVYKVYIDERGRVTVYYTTKGSVCERIR